MKFDGYVYKFKLNASHSLLMYKKRNDIHSHTFEISIFVKILSDKFILYDEVEKAVNKYLENYNSKELNKIEPFDKIEPTLENMGNFFYRDLKKILADKDIKLVKLEISETPARVYIVSDGNMIIFEDTNNENILTRLTMKNIIDSTSKQMINKFDKNYNDNENNAFNNNIKENNLHNGHEDNEKVIDYSEYQWNDVEKIQKRSNHKYMTFLSFLSAVFLLVLASVLLVFYLLKAGGYPWGIDTLGHIFKSNMLYGNIKNGNIYPLFTKLWYNGIQPFRYWGPLTYYILAGCQSIAGGNPAYGYVVFIGVIFFIGGFGWLLWGIKEKRIFLSFIIAILWFFFPENIRVLMFEGNLPRVVIDIFIPYLFYFLWQYVEYDKKLAIIPMMLFMMLMIMSHLMIAAMVGITSFIFLFSYSIIMKKYKRPFDVITAMLLSFALCGIWLYPALKGGLVSMDSGATSDVMKALSTKSSISLDPFIRLTYEGKNGYFYYGMSIILISVFGIIVSNKKCMPGFITAIIVFLGTTTAFIPFLSKLPLNQLLWMTRFTPVAYGFFIVSLLNWKKCRRFFMLIMIALIASDSLLSANLSLYPADRHAVNENIINSAKQITNQRIALLDSSMFGSYPSFYICSDGKSIPYAYGWAWQGAATAQNIVLLNTALENGYYSYMFDRSVELGCDTIIVRKESLEKGKRNLSEIKRAGELSNYNLYKETTEGYIFHRNTPKSFGVITKYKNLCIGRSASDVALQYPSFEIGRSWNIEDYTIDELKKYNTIYLSDFRYNSRSAAEKMITRLSSDEVKIIIDMNRIPSDSVSHRMVFLGVTAQPVIFYKKMPDMYYNGSKITTVPFKKEYEKWNTVYLQNVQDIKGFSWINDKKLIFMGNGKDADKNITFVGFNLMYSGMVNEDPNIINIMNHEMESDSSILPQRILIPIDVRYGNNSITVNSPDNNVNTTISYLDAYKSSSKITEKQHLLNVDKGQTNIDITYPYLLQGIYLSLLGVCGTVILLFFIYKRKCGN